MNKSEALALLHEFHYACKESATVYCVSLDGSQVSHILTGGYQIRMKGEFDTFSRDILRGLVKKHNLTMEERDGYIILRSLGD